MPAKNTALSFTVDAISESKQARLRISISSPYETGKGDWACLFQLRGMKDEEKKREFIGFDALQAVVLNLYYLRSVLSRIRKKGYVFCEIKTGEEIDPERYFDVFRKSA
jgi:hypothetical protein